jgi:hypothetical protein
MPLWKAARGPFDSAQGKLHSQSPPSDGLVLRRANAKRNKLLVNFRTISRPDSAISLQIFPRDQRIRAAPKIFKKKLREKA